MKVLFDTNVLLDVLLMRAPWVDESSQIWQAHHDKRIEGHVAASTVTDVFYLGTRIKGLEEAHTAVRVCIKTFRICPVNKAALKAACVLTGKDFEDNLQMVSASRSKLEAIVTRDKKGFVGSAVPAMSPAQLLLVLNRV